MIRFVIRRLLVIIPIILLVMLLVFGILSLIPGDPGRLILGLSADQEQVEALNEKLGMNDPFFVRFFDYIKGIVTRFDFGISYRNQLPVIDEIGPRVPYTVGLAFMSLICASVIGIPLGILSAVKQYSLLDNITRVMAMLLAAIPGFWLGMMLILLFSLSLGWLPTSGIEGWESFILPTVTLALPCAANILRMTRSTMLETIRQDYIRTVRAKGAPESRVIFKHALKNALLPVITVMGTNMAVLLGSAVVIETVFAVPGLGRLLVDSIRLKDIPLVMATVMFLAVIFCVIILAVDVLYGFVDPRIKAKYVRRG